MICKNCNKEFDSNYSNCPYCHYPAYPQENSNFYSNNQSNNNQGNPYDYQTVNSQNNNSGYSNAQNNTNYQNAYNQQNYQQNYANQNYNQNYNQYNNQHPQEANDIITLMKILGFFLGLLMPAFWFLPLISLVLYFVWRKDKPRTASAISKFTITGIVVGWVLVVLLSILAAVIFFAFAAGPLFEFAEHIIREVINLIPFGFLRDLIREIFGLLPFNIDFELNGVSLLSLI